MRALLQAVLLLLRHWMLPRLSSLPLRMAEPPPGTSAALGIWLWRAVVHALLHLRPFAAVADLQSTTEM